MCYYRYRLYGMRVLSDLAFPQLCSENAGCGEEMILRKMTAEEQEAFLKEHGERRCGSQVGRTKSWLCNSTLQMTVEQGKYLRYHLREAENVSYLRTYLLGYGMAMLALQQGRLPFHCSALEAPEGGAVLIAGASGAGKSTLTGNLLRRGYRFLADDMAVVDARRDSYAMVYPAFPYLKLCRDAVIEQGYLPENLVYIDEKKDKFLVPYTGEFPTEGVRVKVFVLLGKGPEKVNMIKTEKISGAESLLRYQENLFLRHLWRGQCPEPEVWQNCLKMAEKVPACYVERPAAGDSTAEMAAEVHRLQQNV